jgi:hypothetical protein
MARKRLRERNYTPVVLSQRAWAELVDLLDGRKREAGAAFGELLVAGLVGPNRRLTGRGVAVAKERVEALV